MINIYFDQVKVGDVYNFSAPPDALGRGAQGCENCNRQILEGTLVTGQVPITQALWMAPNVNELDENEVKEYLTQHLRWTVTMVGLTHPLERSLRVSSQILSYAATPLIFMGNSYPGDPYAYINPHALLALCLALLGQVAIAIWCLRSTALSVPTWSSNPLNTTLAVLHFHLQRRTSRCILSVDQSNLNSVPSLPRDRQRCLLKATPAIVRILRFIWILAALAAIWAISILLVSRADIWTNGDGASWQFSFDWYVNKGTDGASDLNDISLSMDDLYNTGASTQLVLGVLFVFVVQGLQSMGLHCTELLVNMWRDEGAWRAAYVEDHEGCMRMKKKHGGARLKTGFISSAISSGPYIFLFVMKALLHWLLGQSISPSIYITPPDDGANLITFPTNVTDLSGFAFQNVTFDMLYSRLIVYTLGAITFGIFATTLARWRPNGPQPVTWGHLQTLADLIDDWTVDEDGDLWWGDKGSNHEGIRHAGTSAKRTDLAEIDLKAFYEGCKARQRFARVCD